MAFFSYLGRFMVMGIVTGWFLGRYLLGRIRLWFVRDVTRRRQELAKLRGRILRQALSAMGATFVKLGQVLSTRPDLLDGEIIDELRKLQDKMPPFAFSKVRRIVEEELGGKLEDHFSEFDEQPVAAASVAQVHRARLRDGTEVAVKVLRPDIHRKVERDAAIMINCARVVAWSKNLRLSDPVGHMRHFVRGIVEQTDLTFEVRNYDIFGTHFKDFPGVRFPKVLVAHSAPRVMTMEFLRGTKLDALPPGDHRPLARRLQQVILKMCFEDGFVHADLHPGNLLVHESGDLCIFDVGLVKQLDDQLLVQFTDFIRVMVMGTPDDFIGHVKRFHTYVVDADWEAMKAAAGDLLDHFRKLNVAQLEMGQLANDLFALGRRFRVVPVADMALVIVGLVTAEGIGKQLHPDDNLFHATAEFLRPLIAKRGLSVVA